MQLIGIVAAGQGGRDDDRIGQRQRYLRQRALQQPLQPRVARRKLKRGQGKGEAEGWKLREALECPEEQGRQRQHDQSRRQARRAPHEQQQGEQRQAAEDRGPLEQRQGAEREQQGQAKLQAAGHPRADESGQPVQDAGKRREQKEEADQEPGGRHCTGRHRQRHHRGADRLHRLHSQWHGKEEAGGDHEEAETKKYADRGHADDDHGAEQIGKQCAEIAQRARELADVGAQAGTRKEGLFVRTLAPTAHQHVRQPAVASMLATAKTGGRWAARVSNQGFSVYSYLPTSTSLALMMAVASSPFLRSSSSTASLVMAAVMTAPPAISIRM